MPMLPEHANRSLVTRMIRTVQQENSIGNTHIPWKCQGGGLTLVVLHIPDVEFRDGLQQLAEQLACWLVQ